MGQRECESISFEFRDLAINRRKRFVIATAENKSTAKRVSKREAN